MPVSLVPDISVKSFKEACLGELIQLRTSRSSPLGFVAEGFVGGMTRRFIVLLSPIADDHGCPAYLEFQRHDETVVSFGTGMEIVYDAASVDVQNAEVGQPGVLTIVPGGRFLHVWPVRTGTHYFETVLNLSTFRLFEAPEHRSSAAIRKWHLQIRRQTPPHDAMVLYEFPPKTDR